VLGHVATAFALAAAFLNAAFEFRGPCRIGEADLGGRLGCQMYLLIRRTIPSS
jgi:hypothetical protein